MIINKKVIDKQMESSLDTIEEKSTKGIRINGTSFDLSDNTLILRKSGRNFKEKIMIDLENISSTRVRKNANKLLLILSIFFLVVGGGATYPIYLYFGFWAFISLGVGLILFIILFSIYISSRNIKIQIDLKNGSNIKRTCKDMKSFDRINEFFDDLFYKKHK